MIAGKCCCNQIYSGSTSRDQLHSRIAWEALGKARLEHIYAHRSIFDGTGSGIHCVCSHIIIQNRRLGPFDLKIIHSTSIIIMKSDGKGQPVPLKQHEDNDDVVTTTEQSGDIPVVQATAVPVMKGEVQPPAYRDWQFSVLFFIQVGAIAFTAIFFGSAAVEGIGAASDESETSDSENYSNKNYNNIEDDDVAAMDSSDTAWTAADIIFFIVGSFLLASLVVMSVFRIIVRYPLQVIHVSFFMAPITFGFVALVILASSAGTNNEE